MPMPDNFRVWAYGADAAEALQNVAIGNWYRNEHLVLQERELESKDETGRAIWASRCVYEIVVISKYLRPSLFDRKEGGE